MRQIALGNPLCLHLRTCITGTTLWVLFTREVLIDDTPVLHGVAIIIPKRADKDHPTTTLRHQTLKEPSGRINGNCLVRRPLPLRCGGQMIDVRYSLQSSLDNPRFVNISPNMLDMWIVSPTDHRATTEHSYPLPLLQ